MTVGLSDLFELPCSPELISAGITFACRSQLRPFKTRSRVPVSLLRRLCADAIASISLRRWLTSEKTPHGLALIAPLTAPYAYHITLGGRHLQVLNQLIINRSHIRKLRHDPQMLLQSEVALRDVHAPSERYSPGDPIAVSILIAHVCRGYAETRHKTDSGERASSIAIPPRAVWRQQRPWRPLGRLNLTNPGHDLLCLELCGLLSNRSPTIERITIPAGQSKEISSGWHNLLHLHTTHIPTATIRIHSPARKANWFISPGNWTNLWLYEPRLMLVGWHTSRELRRLAMPAFGDKQSRLANRSPRGGSIVQVHALRPVKELLRITRHI